MTFRGEFVGDPFDQLYCHFVVRFHLQSSDLMAQNNFQAVVDAQSSASRLVQSSSSP